MYKLPARTYGDSLYFSCVIRATAIKEWQYLLVESLHLFLIERETSQWLDSGHLSQQSLQP